MKVTMPSLSRENGKNQQKYINYVYFMFFATRLMSWKGVQVLLFCLAAKTGQNIAPLAAAMATFGLKRKFQISFKNLEKKHKLDGFRYLPTV